MFIVYIWKGIHQNLFKFIRQKANERYRERETAANKCCLFIHVCNFIHPRPCNHSLVSLFVCCFTALLLQHGACSLGLKHSLFLALNVFMCLSLSKRGWKGQKEAESADEKWPIIEIWLISCNQCHTHACTCKTLCGLIFEFLLDHICFGFAQ